MVTLIKPESELYSASSNYSWCEFRWDALGYCEVNDNGAFFTTLPYTCCFKVAVDYRVTGTIPHDCTLAQKAFYVCIYTHRPLY